MPSNWDIYQILPRRSMACYRPGAPTHQSPCLPSVGETAREHTDSFYTVLLLYLNTLNTMAVNNYKLHVEPDKNINISILERCKRNEMEILCWEQKLNAVRRRSGHGKQILYTRKTVLILFHLRFLMSKENFSLSLTQIKIFL